MSKNEEKVHELRERKNKIIQMGGEKQVAAQHKLGKLTARERIDKLFDSNTFNEIDALVTHRCTLFGLEKREIPADAIVTGFGKVNGKPAYVAAEDYTTFAGTFGEMHGRKLCKVLDLAYASRVPFVQIIDSGGARLQEGQDSSEWYAWVFRSHTLYNGVIPQISLLMGHCGGGAAYGPALTDFIIMVKGTSFMYMGGPAFVKTLLGYEATAEELGGATLHGEITGLADLVAESDEQAIEFAKELLSFLPPNNGEYPPFVEPTDSPDRKNENILEISTLPEIPTYNPAPLFTFRENKTPRSQT